MERGSVYRGLLQALVASSIFVCAAGDCSVLDAVSGDWWSHYTDAGDTALLTITSTTLQTTDSSTSAVIDGASYTCDDGLEINGATYVLATDTGSVLYCIMALKRDHLMLYRIATSEPADATLAGQCRDQMVADTSTVYQILFPSNFDFSGATCPSDLEGTYQLQYQTGSWECVDDRSSQASVSSTEMALTSCFTGTVSYYEPYILTFTCIDAFSPVLLGASSQDTILVLTAEIDGVRRFFSGRYSVDYATSMSAISLAVVDGNRCDVTYTQTATDYSVTDGATNAGYRALQFSVLADTTTPEPPTTTAANNEETTAAATSSDTDMSTSASCAESVDVDARESDLTDDAVAIFQITYDLEWSCDILADAETFAGLVVEKLEMVLDDGITVHVRTLSSGTVIAEVATTNSTGDMGPELTSATGVSISDAVSAGSLDIMYDGSSVAAISPVQYHVDVGSLAPVSDGCFNFDADDTCNDGSCAVQDGVAACVCPDDTEGAYCSPNNDDEILIPILVTLCVVAVLLLFLLISLIVSRRKRRNAGILKQDPRWAGPVGPPPKTPLPQPDEEDWDGDYGTSVAVHQPVYDVMPQGGAQNQGFSLESSHTGTAIANRSKPGIISNGGMASPDSTLYRITSATDAGRYGWFKL